MVMYGNDGNGMVMYGMVTAWYGNGMVWYGNGGNGMVMEYGMVMVW